MARLLGHKSGKVMALSTQLLLRLNLAVPAIRRA